jgi:hypothetical protein
MFNSIKSALGLGKAKKEAAQEPASAFADGSASQFGKVSEWASLQGLTVSERGRGYMMDGQIQGRPWRMEQGKPSRDFIQGIELRARGELGLREDVAVMLMTRPLKNELDKRAFSLYTDTLQTQIDPHLPEEMRWLSMYEEVGWEELGKVFLDQYAILADHREHAVAWLTPELAGQLLTWPSSQQGVPRVLMVLRGKVYLRMQITDGDIPTLDHATRVFTTACSAGIGAFSMDVAS